MLVWYHYLGSRVKNRLCYWNIAPRDSPLPKHCFLSSDELLTYNKQLKVWNTPALNTLTSWKASIEEKVGKSTKWQFKAKGPIQVRAYFLLHEVVRIFILVYYFKMLLSQYVSRTSSWEEIYTILEWVVTFYLASNDAYVVISWIDLHKLRMLMHVFSWKTIFR